MTLLSRLAVVFNPYVNDPDVVSARGLVTAALVLYGVFGFLFIFVVPYFILFIIVGLLSFVIIGVVYVTLQASLERGNVGRAAVSALVLGILSILLINIISGILLLVAYGKIRCAERIMKTGDWGGVSTGRVSPSAPTRGDAGSGVLSKDTHYCASCGAPLVPLIRNCTSCGTRVPPRPGPPTND